MHYQIHLCLKCEDGIFRHIPLYFCYTTDKEKAVENFHKAYNQIFEFDDKPKIQTVTYPNSFGTILSAVGEVKTSFDFCGTYLLELSQSEFKPSTCSLL